MDNTTDPQSPQPDQAPSSAFRIAQPGHTFTLTRPCPYCGGKISVRATGWTQQEDGSWAADMIDMECDTEPAIGSPDWPNWSDIHGDFDYCAAWHSLHDAVIAMLKRRVRFDLNTPNTELTHR